MQTNQTATINPEYEQILPKLSVSEYEALKESIRTEGQHYPIILNPEGVILDGHNRFKICQELSIEPIFETKSFPIKLIEKKFVIETNLRRRQLSDFQKIELASPLLGIERELARKRQVKAGESFGRGKKSSASNDVKLSEGKATAKVAKTVGLSTKTFERGLTIIKKGNEKLKESLRKGKTSITYAYTKLRREEKHQETPELPKETFDVVYADPPWKYDLSLRGDSELHYQTMETKEICETKPTVADDAILFLWATNPKLEDALKVLHAWGFEYKTNMAWVKDKIGTGYYVRGQHELLLIAKRGNIPVPTDETRPPSVIVAPRQEHSHKPTVVYDLIERMYPNRKYLEMFTTEKRANWVSWGLPHA